MIPLFSLYENAQTKLKETFFFNNQRIYFNDIEHFWPRAQKRFSLTKLYTSFPEYQRYDVDLMFSEEEEDVRISVLDTLHWYDEETYENAHLLADEELEEHESIDMGYHNLTTEQLDFDVLDHLSFMEDMFLKQSKRLKEGKSFDKTLFSLSPGSITGIDDGNFLSEWSEDHELTHFQHPDWDDYDDEIYSDALDFEVINMTNYQGVHVDFEYSNDEEELDRTFFDNDRGRMMWLYASHWVNLFPYEQVLNACKHSFHFRRASFLKYKYIGLSALSQRQGHLMWKYASLYQHFIPRFDIPRVVFRTWFTRTYDMDVQKFLIENHRSWWQSPKSPKWRRSTRVPLEKAKLMLNDTEDDFFDGQVSSIRKKFWLSGGRLRFTLPLTTLLKRFRAYYKEDVRRIIKGQWGLRNKLMNKEAEEVVMETLSQKEKPYFFLLSKLLWKTIPYKSGYWGKFKKIDRISKSVLFFKKEKKNRIERRALRKGRNIPVMKESPFKIRKFYPGYLQWHSTLSTLAQTGYRLDFNSFDTTARQMKRHFRYSKWRFNYNFNRYFTQKTFAWYLFYYTMVPFKETFNETMGDHLMELDYMYFKKWRDGMFFEKSFTSFFHPFVSWLNYVFSIMNREIPKHPFHIVTPSPWPLLAAFGALILTTGGVLYMHMYKFGGLTLLCGLFYLIAVVTLWWRDVVREASFLGNHTAAVQTSLKIGVALFIVSEVMFFFAFFWAFFHSSLSPAIDVGSVWPPLGITPISPYGIPLFNSFILALSGYTVTYAHHAMLEGERNHVFSGLIFTLFLAFLFSTLQFVEYRTLPFLLSDGIYGSTFFMTTGFHALHVIIGSTFLLVCLFRLTQFTKTHHIGFEAAIWYWHFVDVVWLFLWLSIYWWPSLQ